MNNQEKINILKKYTKEKGLKFSQTRIDILKFFLKSKTHLSAEELYNKISKKIPNIGLSTVYRNLKLFCECNLAQVLKLNDGIVRYEPSDPDDHHDHLICVKCGKILEILNTKIEKLQVEIAKDNNFILQSHRMDLYGVCKSCKNNK